jgi:nicotinate-nucleotide adenylyltransferase
MNKIGIFGGSFNPPHVGHLILAERCRELLQLDKIIFIPAYISPHKTNMSLVNPKDRLKMLKLSIKDNPYFDYSDIEIKRKGKSFTYDTLVSLLSRYKKSKLYLLIGMDNYNDFCNWKNYKEILQLCKVVVINRRTTKNKRIENSNIDYSRFIFVDTLIIDISSTEIRNRIKKRLSIRYYTTENVKNFIVKNNLYI